MEPSWNPLRCRGTDLPLNLTIMVKVLAMVLLLVNHVRILPDPWLPFIPGLELFPPLLFQRTLQTVFVLAAIAIVLAPSAATAAGLAETVITCDGSAGANVKSISSVRSNAVIDTRTGPAVLSLCRSTIATPLVSAVTLA